MKHEPPDSDAALSDVSLKTKEYLKVRHLFTMKGYLTRSAPLLIVKSVSTIHHYLQSKRSCSDAWKCFPSNYQYTQVYRKLRVYKTFGDSTTLDKIEEQLLEMN